jgi:protein-S-isoprenylcysteine O-methyltransferase Ste14
MGKTASARFLEQLIIGGVIGALLSVLLVKFGWHHPSLFSPNVNHFDYDIEWNRVTPCLWIWFLFFAYWTVASRNTAPTKTAESPLSAYFHQAVLALALVLLFWPAPGLEGWFLPQRFHFLVALGVVVQAAFALLGIWARRHLGRNWSGEVRIGEDHELVRTGPYRIVRHPIYTAMLGMFLGTAIASSQYHALVGLAVMIVAYLRKTHLEDQILHQTFGAEYDAYQKTTRALVPFVF